jgi:polysaccharide biosynthesis transport protein
MSTLSDYLALVRRRKWIILQAVVLIPVLAVLLSMQQQPVYSASAEVLLSRQNLAAALAGIQDPLAFQDPSRMGQTEADRARAPEVAERAVEAAEAPRSPGELLSNSEVSPKSNADLLVFTVRDTDRDLAVSLANAYALEYTRFRQESDSRDLRSARTQLTERIRELEASGLGRESELLSNLIDKEQELRTLEALQTSNTSLSRPAGGASQIEPRVVRNGILGVLLAVVLGLGLAFLWDALDRRVRSEKEIQDVLGIPLVARLPEPPRRLRRSNTLAMIAEPSSLDAEAFRVLRTSVEFLNLDHQAKTIMVTSAQEGEGKSTTIANLGVALARAGRRTVLVDLDLRRPALGRMLDVPQRPGITDVVLGSVSLDSALARVPIVGEPTRRPARGNGNRLTGFLDVLPGGTMPPDPGDLVRTAALAEVLDEVEARADVVLVDAPPLLAVGDALALSAHADALLIVVSFSRATRPMLAELSRLLAMSGARRLGFVLTGVAKAQAYGYAYDGYSPATAADQPEPLRK